MELNKDFVNDLAQTLKVDAEKIETAITGKQRLSELESPVKYFWTDAERETLSKNAGSESYKQGKLAGTEMLFKDFKKSYAESDNELMKNAFAESNNIEEAIVKISSLQSDYVKSEREKALKEAGIEVDKSVEEWRTKYTHSSESHANEKKALQELLTKTKAESENQIKELQSMYQRKEIENHLSTEFQVLNFKDVPAEVAAMGNDKIAEYQKEKRNQAMTLFNATYETSKNENGVVEYKNRITGDKLVNDLQEPLSTVEVIKKFAAEKYLNVQSVREAGRGGSDSNTGGHLKLNNTDEFVKYVTAKGINPMSIEASKILSDIKSKNPNFKQ